MHQTMNPLTLFAEWFDPIFRDHVEQLQNDTIYRNKFQSLVRAMDYTQWIQSPKWKATAKLKRLIQPTCEGCECHQKTALEVHHRTYDHIGIEVLYLDDLAVLCPGCHMAAHHCDYSYSDAADDRRLVRNAVDAIATASQTRFSFEPGRTTVQKHRARY
jgi:hypothetical protein